LSIPAGACVIVYSAEAGGWLARWVCPHCSHLGGGTGQLVDILKLAGARTVGPDVNVRASRCEHCRYVVLADHTDTLVCLGRFGAASMQRWDCPACERVNLSDLWPSSAHLLIFYGARQVVDALDLVPEEVDALGDPSVDLHDLLGIPSGPAG
jgi:ribosomal protein S27AE